MYDDATPAEKAVLQTLAMMAEAKATLVKVSGIGSELLPAIVAFEGPDPIGYAILTTIPESDTSVYRRIGEAAGMMVAGWHATGLALALESYAQEQEPFDTNQHATPLSIRYATDPTIREALWVAYADRLGSMSMGVMTYTQTVGRNLELDEPTLSSIEQHADFHEPGTYPNLIVTNLTHIEPRPYPTGSTRQQAREAIAAQLERIGFSTFLEDQRD